MLQIRCAFGKGPAIDVTASAISGFGDATTGNQVWRSSGIYTDVTAAYRFDGPIGSRSEAFRSVANLFNQEPPNTNIGVSTTNAITNYSLYDVLERHFHGGVLFGHGRSQRIEQMMAMSPGARSTA